MNLYFIRHGRQSSTDCNVNVELSSEGRLQAQLLGERMKQYPIDALYTSDLIRAVETGEIAFAHNPQLLENHQIRPELAEIDFGALTGIEDAKVKEYYREYYEKQLELFIKGTKNPTGTALDKVNQYVGDFFVPPEEMWYPEGENGAMVLERVLPVIQEFIDSSYENIAIVTHGGVIRILLCSLFGGDFAKRLQFGSSLENCSITQLYFDKAKYSFYLERFNDYAHLEGHPELLRKHFNGPGKK